MSLEQFFIESVAKQGVLGSLLIIFILMFKKFIGDLFRVVNNNTEALTKTADALRQVESTIKKCEK